MQKQEANASCVLYQRSWACPAWPDLHVWCASLPFRCPLHCCHRLAGTGDKRVLRAALAQLGLPRAAARVKRAIQFGSRIGKQSNCREFGSNRAANARAAGTVQISALRGPPPLACQVGGGGGAAV